jgi:hypothetical protein
MIRALALFLAITLALYGAWLRARSNWVLEQQRKIAAHKKANE